MTIRELTLRDEGFKKAYTNGKFILDCLEITLTQNTGGSQSSPLTYSASGYFFLSPEDGVEARLVVLRREGPSREAFFAQFYRMMSIKSGQLFPEGNFFAISAKDVNGNIWSHPAAKIFISDQSESLVITISCSYLQCKFPDSTGHNWTNMVFLEDIELPSNLVDQAKRMVRGKPSPVYVEHGSAGQAAGLSIVYESRKGRVGEAQFNELYVEPLNLNAKFPQDFDEKILEAIRFATAKMFWPVMVETVYNGVRTLELHKRIESPRSEMINPPLDIRGNVDHFYNLVGCFFSYACKNSKVGESTRLAVKLGGLFTLKGVWIETVALLVSVTVEALLKSKRFDLIGAVDARTIKQVSLIQNAVKKSFANEKLKERANSSIGGLMQSRPADKIHPLEELGVLNAGDRRTWQNLRNISAHGSLHVDPKKMQALLNDIYRTVTLVYKIVFLEIGYVGKYTDYSTLGWPLAEFDAENAWLAINACGQEEKKLLPIKFKKPRLISSVANTGANAGRNTRKRLTDLNRRNIIRR